MSTSRTNYERVAYSLLLVTPEVIEKYVNRRYPSVIMNFKEPFKEKLPPEQWNQVEELIGRFGLHQFYNYINHTVLDKTVLDNLKSKDLISVEDGEKISGQKTQSEKNKTVLDILIKKPGDHYNHFIEALKKSKENRKFVCQPTRDADVRTEAEIKIKIIRNYDRLVGEIDSSVILDELMAKEVLDDDLKEKINHCKTTSKKNRLVINTVIKKSECVVFLKALGKDQVYNELIEEIKATEVTEEKIQSTIQEGHQHGSRIDVSTLVHLVSVLFEAEIPTVMPSSDDISFGADFYRLRSYITYVIDKDDIDDEMMTQIFSEITEILVRLDGPEIKNVLENDFGNRKQEFFGILKKLKGINKDFLIKDMVDVTVTEGCDANFEIWTKENIKYAKWFKDEKEITNSKRYETHNSGTIKSLKIHTTNLDDKGVYKVRLQGVERRARLDVKEYFTKSPPSIVECDEGTNVEFSYEVLDEKAAVVWRKSGYEINNITKYEIKDHGKTHTLSLKKTELDDAGNYSVQVNDRTRITELKVKAYFSTDLVNKECFEGDNVILECTILDENKKAQWSKDGVVVQSLDRYKVQQQGRHHQLHVINTRLKDKGEYCILIKNCRRECVLTVREKPKRALSKVEKSLYLDTIKSANETRFNIRIVIIGENGVGKTCLLRRLLKMGIEDVKSTDGIDINRCKIRKNDGTWIYDKVTDKRKELISRLKRSIFDQTRKHTHSVIDSDSSRNAVIEPSYYNLNKTHLVDSPNGNNKLQMVHQEDNHQFPADSLNESKKNPQTTILRKAIKESKEAALLSLDNQPNRTHQVLKELTQPITTVEQQMTGDTIEHILSNKIVQELSILLDDIETYEMSEDVFVDCGFWDFAGQREYYPTHTIFLNQHAIHLLVADITKDIKPVKAGKGFDQIGEYLDFWFDSVHSLRDLQPKDENTQDILNPPVILVCTNIDKCEDKEDANKLEKRMDNFRQLLIDMLGDKKRKHIRGILHVSNIESTEEEFDELRKVIFEVGKEMQTFGEQIPLNYIRLERAIDIVRETGANILSRLDVNTLAYECSFYNEYEINRFLIYQHKIGNIIYFEELNETIILNHKWLTDAFKCLISVRFDEAVKRTRAWRQLEETGQLADNLIAELFKKEPKLDFNKHRHHILKVMEMFGIIFKVTVLRSGGFRQTLPTYYMPNMITSESSIEDLKIEFCVTADGCSQSPWLLIEFEFMPFDVFNNIMCEFLSRYSVCIVPGAARIALYHGLGVFDLNDTELQKLVICFCTNTIALQVWKWGWEPIEKGKFKEIVDLLQLSISRYETKFERRKLTYTLMTKCSDGDILNPDGKKSFTDLLSKEKYLCKHDKKLQIHYSQDFLETWFYKHSEEKEEVKNSEQVDPIPVTLRSKQLSALNEKCQFKIAPYDHKVFASEEVGTPLVNLPSNPFGDHLNLDYPLFEEWPTHDSYQLSMIHKSLRKQLDHGFGNNKKYEKDAGHLCRVLCILNKTSRGKDLYPGYNMDSECTYIQQLSKKLRWSLQLYKNKSSDEIEDILDSERQRNFDQNHSLFVIIVTLGDRAGIYGTEGGLVEYWKITTRFDGITSLKGKPKVFLFDSCDTGREDQMDCHPVRNIGIDTFICMASTLGRCDKVVKGSWLIGALISVMCEAAQRMTFQQMMKQVVLMFENVWIPDGKPDLFLSITDDLTKDFFLLPPAPVDPLPVTLRSKQLSALNEKCQFKIPPYDHKVFASEEVGTPLVNLPSNPFGDHLNLDYPLFEEWPTHDSYQLSMIHKSLRKQLDHGFGNNKKYEKDAGHQCRVLCILNKTSRGKDLYPGYNMDSECTYIQQLSKKLKWSLQLHKNKSSDEIEDILNYTERQRNYDQYHSLFVIIVTLGDRAGIYGTEGGLVEYWKITTRFDDIASLQGKPKVFLFDDCDIGRCDKVVKGSWLIGALISVMCKAAHRMTFQQMMKQVVLMFETARIPAGKPDLFLKISDELTKDFYLLPPNIDNVTPQNVHKSHDDTLRELSRNTGNCPTNWEFKLWFEYDNIKEKK